MSLALNPDTGPADGAEEPLMDTLAISILEDAYPSYAKGHDCLHFLDAESRTRSP